MLQFVQDLVTEVSTSVATETVNQLTQSGELVKEVANASFQAGVSEGARRASIVGLLLTAGIGIAAYSRIRKQSNQIDLLEQQVAAAAAAAAATAAAAAAPAAPAPWMPQG